MTSKNPLIINWDMSHTNLINCGSGGCAMTPKYPRADNNSFVNETNEGILKLKNFSNHKIESSGGTYLLDEILIATNSFNYYKGGSAAPLQLADSVPTKAEVIMIHTNESTPGKKLYICFLLDGVETGDKRANLEQSYGFFNDLMKKDGKIENWTMKAKLPALYGITDLIPKTPYNKLSGGDFNDLFGEKYSTHEFYLFPLGSASAVPKEFIQWLNVKNINWNTKYKMPLNPAISPPEYGSNKAKSDIVINDEKKEFQRNKEGLGGMMMSGKIGVITECTEVVDSNGLEVPYLDNNLAAPDSFVKYDSNGGIEAWLNADFILGLSHGKFLLVLVIIIALGIWVKGLVGPMLKSGKKSAVPPATIVNSE
jgi:hypothetical protein